MNPVSVKCNLCGADDYKVMYSSTVKGTLATVEECVNTAKRA